MHDTGTPKRPLNRALVGLALLACALFVVACGSSSPSSSTSANVAGGSTTTGTTGSGSSTGSTGANSAGGATTGSGTTGSTASKASTGSTQAAHGHVKRATKTSSPAGTARGRIKGSTLRRCLEQHGIKAHTRGSKASTRGQLQAALQRCDPELAKRTGFRPNARARRKLLARPGYRQGLAKFTACMRRHGVPNFPEANTSGNGPLYPPGAVKASPQLRAAQKACIGQLSGLH